MTLLSASRITIAIWIPVRAQEVPGQDHAHGGTSATVVLVSDGLPGNGISYPEGVTVRIHDRATRSGGESQPLSLSELTSNTSDSICNFISVASHGQIAPGTGGGTLSPGAFFNPSTINSNGRVAFYSQVLGSDRNQGVFVADANGIGAVAIGCGGGGGSGDPGTACGDPSPDGGTFSGFFGGTVFTPDINDSGDVLFISDIDGGSSTRALFLYRADSLDIVKVSGVGDPSPLGGTFGAVGPGSLNNSGKVVFLASPTGSLNSDIFLWMDGIVTKVAAAGDPAPGGGTFSLLGTESYGFADGSSIPVGPVPDINDEDQICFRAIVTGGITDRGIVVRTGGTDQWYIKVPDPTPAGGTYFDMQAASMNNDGQIAFFADYRPTPTTFSSGWFAGDPGNWRKVIAFFDIIDGGQCLGLAFSRNPMQSIDASGNVIFWTDLNGSGGEDRLAMGLADGSQLIAGRRGEVAPIGGTLGSMDAWPSADELLGTLNASTPGATGGALSAHLAFERCGSVVSVDDASPASFEFYLFQNYPNPFNPVTEIGYTVVEPGQVVLHVYDLLGREVATLVDQPMKAGEYRVTWNAAGHASGVYFYRLTAASQTIGSGKTLVETRKLVLMR